MVDGAGLGLDEFVEAQAIGLPLADVVGVLVSEHQGGVGDDVGDLVQLIAGLVAVQLEELQDVVAEHFLDTDLRLGVRDGAKQQVEAAGRRQDGAFADEADGRHFGVDILGRGRGFL